MEEELISKKDLLEKTGISYGQLYRWKRKNLIPDEWFVRKSTFTGQETFFPKILILERIEQIKNMKDELSLNDLAGIFSTSFTGIVIKKENMAESGLVSEKSLGIFYEYFGDIKEFDFLKILYIYALEKLFSSLPYEDLTIGNLVFSVLDEHYSKFSGKNCNLILLKKSETYSAVLISNDSVYYFDHDTKIIGSININECIEYLKIKLI